jgi:geranylgeranyl reductase family protein
MIYDVVIVGAGPAGSTVAYELSRHNVSTLVLERETIPRKKPCAGMLTGRVTRLVDYDLSPVIDCQIRAVRYRYANNPPVTRETSEPFLYSVKRPLFDSYLVHKAVSKGAILHTQSEVLSAEIDKAPFLIRTKRGVFYGRVLVGADGAASTIRRMFQPRPLLRWSTGANLEISFGHQEECCRVLRPEMLDLQLGIGKGVVTYAIPKIENITVGVFSHHQLDALEIRRYIHRHLRTLDVSDNLTRASTKIEKESRWIIPHYQQMRLPKLPVLLVGDAAGLADPLFGEGIYYAIRSAQLASESILHGLQTGAFDFRSYVDSLQKEMGREFLVLQWIRHIFDLLPRTIYELNARTESGFIAGASFANGNLSSVKFLGLLPRCCLEWLKDRTLHI